MTTNNEIVSSLFGTCEVIEVVKGKGREIIIARNSKGHYWVTWGKDTYFVTGNLCMDHAIETARERAKEYIAIGYGDKSVKTLTY